jgi:hypothetical protein
VSTDVALRKVFSITERQNLEIRIESFNVFNHAAFSQPDNFIDDGPGATAVITSTTLNQRQFQFGARYSF